MPKRKVHEVDAELATTGNPSKRRAPSNEHDEDEDETEEEDDTMPIEQSDEETWVPVKDFGSEPSTQRMDAEPADVRQLTAAPLLPSHPWPWPPATLRRPGPRRTPALP